MAPITTPLQHRGEQTIMPNFTRRHSCRRCCSYGEISISLAGPWVPTKGGQCTARHQATDVLYCTVSHAAGRRYGMQCCSLTLCRSKLLTSFFSAVPEGRIDTAPIMAVAFVVRPSTRRLRFWSLSAPTRVYRRGQYAPKCLSKIQKNATLMLLVIILEFPPDLLGVQ